MVGFPSFFDAKRNPVIRKALIGFIGLYVVVQGQLINVAFQAWLLAVSLVSIADQANVVAPTLTSARRAFCAVVRATPYSSPSRRIDGSG